ncbi:hypothetical protein [Paraburkholderia caffeinilytica]|uniref:hypothetical protein n=1 Tax=Paraburkholderia caffeinilytica TaxID=1761016 RepID=UPI0038BA679E
MTQPQQPLPTPTNAPTDNSTTSTTIPVDHVSTATGAGSNTTDHVLEPKAAVANDILDERVIANRPVDPVENQQVDDRPQAPHCEHGGKFAMDEQAAPSPMSQHDQPHMIAVVATAYDPDGCNPHCVIEFNHPRGQRVQRLLPVSAFESEKHLRKALIKLGVPVATARVAAADLTMEQPFTYAMRDVPYGWSQGCDRGAMYRFGDMAYTASGPIPVYADGPVPVRAQDGDLGGLKDALASDASPENVLLFAVHYLGPLVQLFGQRPFVIVVSGVSNEVAVRLGKLAGSAFGTAPATPMVRASSHDGSLVQLISISSRAEAFSVARSLVAAKSDRKAVRVPSPVTLLLTAEAENPKNLASPQPPTGCIEIPFDAWVKAAAGKPRPPNEITSPTGESNASSMLGTEPAQPDTSLGARATDFGAVAATSYLEAVVCSRDAVIRQSDKKIPNFVNRSLERMKVKRDDANVQAATTFALLHFALTCGQNLKTLPWTSDVCHEVMDKCVACWAERHRTRDGAFERCVLDAVKSLTATGMSAQNRTAFGREVTLYTYGGRELVLIESSKFEASIVAGRNKSRVIDVLRKRRLLVTNGDGAQFQKRVDGGSRQWFYAFDASVVQTL